MRNDLVFTCAALLLVAVTYTPLVAPLNESLCAVSYRGARAILDIFGVPYVTDPVRSVLSSGSFALEVSGLCSGLRAIALWCGVMALLPLRQHKVIHFVVGSVVLMMVNVVRIAHLFHLGAGGSPQFELYHEWIWPTAIVGAVLFYRLVILIATWRHPVEVAHA